MRVPAQWTRGLLIGVDGTCWANERGYGRFAREIVAAMARIAPDDEFVCFVDLESGKRFNIPLPNVRNVRVDTRVAASHAASASGYRSALDMLSMSRAVAREKLDVFFSPSVYTYFPLPLGLPAVITIHDAIAERFPSLSSALVPGTARNAPPVNSTLSGPGAKRSSPPEFFPYHGSPQVLLKFLKSSKLISL